MNARVVRPVGLMVVITLIGVAGAATADRSPATATTQAGFGSGAVQAGTPQTEAWAAVADLRPELAAASPNPCRRGSPDCLATVLDEMQARLDRQGCAHTAPFAFTYLEMTRGVHDAVLDRGFFGSPEATSHADALFARLYFNAFDNWTAGRIGDVPAVWQMVFGAAETGEMPAAVDLLMGMNAHISRDLPYVVADVAQWQPSPGPGPSDFDRINDVIASVKSPMLQGAADRFDPTLADLDLPLPGMTASDSVDIIGSWRNRALDRGIRLSQATNDSERQEIEAEIERESMAIAGLLINAGTSRPSPTSPAERDAYCERVHD